MPSETACVDGTKTYDYVTVYTKSALGEQVTPDNSNAADSASSASSSRSTGSSTRVCRHRRSIAEQSASR